MIDFSDVRIFLCTTPTNMHCSFDSLMGRAQEIFDQDPCSGHLFLFLNRSRDRIKILFWDRDGFCIFYKRLESYKASGLEVDVFCLQEGVSRSTIYSWFYLLKDGVPESMVAEKADRERTESGEAAFVPITLKASPVEIELPNGGIVRLPLGVGQAVLVEVIRAVGALRPWKAPKS